MSSKCLRIGVWRGCRRRFVDTKILNFLAGSELWIPSDSVRPMITREIRGTQLPSANGRCIAPAFEGHNGDADLGPSVVQTERILYIFPEIIRSCCLFEFCFKHHIPQCPARRELICTRRIIQNHYRHDVAHPKPARRSQLDFGHCNRFLLLIYTPT